MRPGILFISVLFCLNLAQAQLVASRQVIDLGILDQRLEKEVVVPIYNQSGSDIKINPLVNQGRVNAYISRNIANDDAGELRLNIRSRGGKKVNERIAIYTDYQKTPVELHLKARFRKGGTMGCPDFRKKKKMNNRAIYRTVSDNKQPAPIYLRPKKAIKEDFSDNPMIPACHLVILMDASTSMQSNGRLEDIKKVLRQVVKSLRQQDEVSIIKYNQDDEVVVIKQSVRDEAALIRIIDDIEPWGYTNGYEGIRSAIDLSEIKSEDGRSNHILLCSDGAFNVGEDAGVISDLMRERRNQFNFEFSVLSVGRSVSLADDLKTISRAGHGELYRVKPNGANSKRIKQILVRQLM